MSASVPSAPCRIQLRRTKGWRMPPNTVKVDRTTRWGNPFTREVAEKAGVCGCRMCCVVRFEWNLSESGKQLIRDSLRGKNLACWCPPDSACHADILLMIANDWRDPMLPTEQAAALADTPNPSGPSNPPHSGTKQ